MIQERAARIPAPVPPAVPSTEVSAPAELEDALVSSRVEDEPIFPDEATEMAMRSELRAKGEGVVAAARAASDEGEVAAPLPPLDSLVSRVPPEVREVLDELFRARFTGVRRVSSRALKETAAKGDGG